MSAAYHFCMTDSLLWSREPSDSARTETLDEDYHEGLMREMSTNDLFIKDAFLVFRALCKLTMKPLNPERWVHYRSLEFIGLSGT